MASAETCCLEGLPVGIERNAAGSGDRDCRLCTEALRRPTPAAVKRSIGTRALGSVAGDLAVALGRRVVGARIPRLFMPEVRLQLLL